MKTISAGAVVFLLSVTSASAQLSDAYMQCQYQAILRIDDGVSDPAKIGPAVAAACVREFDAMSSTPQETEFGKKKMKELNIDLSTRAVVITRRHLAKQKGQ